LGDLLRHARQGDSAHPYGADNIEEELLFQDGGLSLQADTPTSSLSAATAAKRAKPIVGAPDMGRNQTPQPQEPRTETAERRPDKVEVDHGAADTTASSEQRFEEAYADDKECD
jgi:hypothetical protein